MKAAVVQLHVGRDVQKNLDTAASLIRSACQAGAELIVLPEMVDYHGPDDAIAEIKSDIPGAVSSYFSEIAKELRIWLLAGSIHENIPNDDRTYNTSLLFNPNGEEVASYRKLHLYDVELSGRVEIKESNTVAAGSEVVTADIDGVRAGLTICYDIRFPELYRKLAKRGAQIMFLPAAFTMFTGKDHWETLIRARAIENQCFMLASGTHGVDEEGKATYGRSMIVDPWGTVLATVGDGDGFAVAELDFDYLKKVRQELPSLANRRRDVFD